VPRLKRWAKRIGVALLALLVALTLASVGYNAATNGEIKPATALYPGPFARVDGRLVAYRTWGHSGTPIVLVGGFVVPSFVWERVGPLLGRTHRVFALDLPPFGYTERKGPYTLRSWVELVRAFDAHFRLRRPVVVGHSLGAAVAVGMALWHPGATRGIVLLDGDAIAGRGAPGLDRSSRAEGRVREASSAIERRSTRGVGAAVQGKGNRGGLPLAAALRDPGFSTVGPTQGAHA
jgi:pimeloyl-ACP methyl ester carboxylesterase